VIAYDVEESQGSPAQTAVVILPDYYRRSLGTPGALQELLTESHHAASHSFVQAILERFYDKYLTEIANHPEIYGPNIGGLVQSLKIDEPLDDELSALSLLFERGNLDAPLGMVRFSSEDAQRRVPGERHYWDKGISTPIKRDKPAKRWLTLPVMQEKSFLRGRYPLTSPFTTKTVQGVSGALCEAKSYWLAKGSDPANQARLYAVARQHAMPWISSQAWPTELDESGRLAMIHSHILVQAYGPIMNRFWNDVSPETEFVLNNVFTSHIPVHFKVETVDNFDSRMLERHERKFGHFLGNTQARLVYNRSLTQTLRTQVKCSQATELKR
jgi:hypothetical protein